MARDRLMHFMRYERTDFGAPGMAQEELETELDDGGLASGMKARLRWLARLMGLACGYDQGTYAQLARQNTKMD